MKTTTFTITNNKDKTQATKIRQIHKTIPELHRKPSTMIATRTKVHQHVECK